MCAIVVFEHEVLNAAKKKFPGIEVDVSLRRRGV
jgi:hypothetical protein